MRRRMAEQRYDAQTAREITIALPSELTRVQNIALVREFVAGELVSRGFAVDWVYHDKPGNPHVHLMHTLRPLAVHGFGRKTRVVLDERGAPTRGVDGKLVYARFMGTPEDFKALRNAWGEYCKPALCPGRACHCASTCAATQPAASAWRPAGTWGRRYRH